MICTGKYDNVADCGLKLFSVSDDINKNKEFGLETYYKLLPSDEFLNKYKNVDLKDFSLKKKFIVDYWNEVLMDLNPYLVKLSLFLYRFGREL